jgi:hypothetical protein
MAPVTTTTITRTATVSEFDGPIALATVADPDRFGMAARAAEIIDGSFTTPITAASYQTPSVYLQRIDASLLQGGGGADGIAFAALVDLHVTGISDAAGGFVALQTQTKLYTSGGAPTNANTGIGHQAVGQVLAGVSNAIGIGQVSHAYLDAGVGTAVGGYCQELNTWCNDRDASAVVGDGSDSHMAGLIVRNTGRFRATVGIWLPLTAQPYFTGIYVQNIAPGGSGLVLDGGAGDAPTIEFRSCGHVWPVTFGADDSAGIGFRALRVPNP